MGVKTACRIEEILGMF